MDVFGEVVKKLAKKYDRSERLVERIYRFQFKYLREHIEGGGFKPVMLHHLGKFVPVKSKADYWRAIFEQGRRDNIGVEELYLLYKRDRRTGKRACDDVQPLSEEQS